MIINDLIDSPNYSSRSSRKPQMIVLHIADGSYEGAKAWFSQSASQTSSHYIVARDGRVCQCVPLNKMAWCNGTTSIKTDNRYFGLSTVPLVQQLGGNANQYSVSIECEGYYNKTQGALTDAQLDALVELIQYIQNEVRDKYGYTIPFDREHIVGHCEITPLTRPNCPGQKFPWDNLMTKLNGQEPEQKTLYRVQVGAFANKSNAQALLDELQQLGYQGFVIGQ